MEISRRNKLILAILEIIQVFEVGDRFNVGSMECFINDKYELVVPLGSNVLFEKNLFDLTIKSLENILYELEDIARSKGYI